MPLQLLFAISTICLRARRVINFSRKYFFSLLFITILKLLPSFMMNIFIGKAICFNCKPFNQMDKCLIFLLSMILSNQSFFIQRHICNCHVIDLRCFDLFQGYENFPSLTSINSSCHLIQLLTITFYQFGK